MWCTASLCTVQPSLSPHSSRQAGWPIIHRQRSTAGRQAACGQVVLSTAHQRSRLQELERLRSCSDR